MWILGCVYFINFKLKPHLLLHNMILTGEVFVLQPYTLSCSPPSISAWSRFLKLNEGVASRNSADLPKAGHSSSHPFFCHEWLSVQARESQQRPYVWALRCLFQPFRASGEMKAEKWLSEAGPWLVDLIEREPERNADVHVEGEWEVRTLSAERGYSHLAWSRGDHPSWFTVAMKRIRQVTAKGSKKDGNVGLH